MPFDPEALKAAAESARRKAVRGSNVTDQLMPAEYVDEQVEQPDVDLTTKYLGLTLKSPLVASAGPISQSLDGIKALAEGGVGAIVMYSLFEEQIRYEERIAQETLEEHANSFAEAMTFFPTAATSDSRTSTYLKLLEDGANAIDVPLIASLNGSTDGGWTSTAHQMQDAGAAAIELNVYMVAGENANPREVEERHLEILQDVKDSVSIPVAMKLSPYFSSFGSMARQLDAEGADGLVLFNRWLQPDIDLGTMEWKPGWGLSKPDDARTARAWISALYGRIKASLAATTGVETSDDVVKYLLAGADVVMTTAALVRHGAGYAQQLNDGLIEWLRYRGTTLEAARGMLAVPADSDSDAYGREGYVSGLEQAKRVYGGALKR